MFWEMLTQIYYKHEIAALRSVTPTGDEIEISCEGFPRSRDETEISARSRPEQKRIVATQSSVSMGWTRRSVVIVHKLYMYIASSSPLVPVVHSFRALSGRLKFTVRRHKFNKDSLVISSSGPFGSSSSHRRTVPGPLDFERAQHKRTPRPSVDGTRSKALCPFGSQQRISRMATAVAEVPRE